MHERECTEHSERKGYRYDEDRAEVPQKKYVRERYEDERFIDTVRRTGIEPFVEYVYATQVPEDEKLLLPDYELIQQGTPYNTPFYSPRF